MSILDLLLAEALAAGMSRMQAEDREEKPPDNFFELPSNAEAWTKLYADCTKEGLVICVEVTKEFHHPSSNTHPYFLELARRVPNIPFIQVRTSSSRTFDKVRKDLGGVETAPTLVIAFFDDDYVRIKQVVGEEKIKFGIRLGIIEGTIKEFLEKRAKNKLAEKMAERFASVLMGDLEKQRRRQYEENLIKEKEELDRRLKETEAQRKAEQEKQKQFEEKQKKIDELRLMDLESSKIADIKGKMDELKISHVGALTRDDLIQRIKKAIPSLSFTKTSNDRSDLANYIVSHHRTEDAAALHEAGTSYTDNSEFEMQQPSMENELLETRMLYACTLRDMEIFGRVSQKDEGVVVRAKCLKPGMPNPERVYAMKIIVDVHSTSTLTKIQTDFKNEYEILSSLPKHENIIQLFAFFYDRPRAYQPLNYLKDGIALCLLMENLSQNMQEHMNNLNMGKGPKAFKSLQWLKDVVCGLLFLFSNHVIHRDMKLENLLLSGDRIKISDFGTAICLDASMKLPFSYVAPRGGNEAHLAPEILNCRVAPGNFLNYSKQPVWEAGVLAYELSGHSSPFERSSVDQRAYTVSSIPPLERTYSGKHSSNQQEQLPRFLTSLVQSMLEYYPDDRPSLEEVKDKLFLI